MDSTAIFAALDQVERLAEDEGAAVVFNGDFHWFDADRSWFAEIEQRVARHRAIRGNVETEIARVNDIGAGCGCAYPASVADDMVRRSNEVAIDLRWTAQRCPGAAESMAALPMHLVAAVGGLRIGIVHGDATTLAGWSLRVRCTRTRPLRARRSTWYAGQRRSTCSPRPTLAWLCCATPNFPPAA